MPDFEHSSLDPISAHKENQSLTVLNCECLFFNARFTPGFEEKGMI